MFRNKPKELVIPPAAKSDSRAIEIARIWAAGGKQHVSLSAEIWEDPAAWGIMLVDLARHVANFYSQERGRGKDEVLTRIKMGFDAEWQQHTSDVEGKAL